MGMNDKVSSARELGWTPDGGGGWNSGNTYNSNNNYNNNSSYNTNRWGDGGNWGSGNRAVLYSGYNLSGETFVVNPGGARNLDRVGFNDKARSLRIESGYWIFCSDGDFQGNCHTYGPGDYPNLPSGQSHASRPVARCRTTTRTATVRTGAVTRRSASKSGADGAARACRSPDLQRIRALRPACGAASAPGAATPLDPRLQDFTQ